MQCPAVDLAGLKAFLAVAAASSFSAAAEQLHLTQPAVSKRVQALESELGIRLFDRVGRRVLLTEAGRTLLPRARGILMAVEDSQRALANLAGRIGGPLRVATSHHIGLHHLPSVLRRFVTRYPEVDLDLRFMDSEAACQAVERGDLELGIVTLPPEPPPHLITTPVWPDPLVVVAARTHPLAKLKQLRPADLAAHPAVLPAASTYTRQIAEAAFRPLGLELKVGLSTNYLETIKMLVSVGLGWSVLPRTLMDRQLCALQLPRLKLERVLGMVQHRERTPSNAARALANLLH